MGPILRLRPRRGDLGRSRSGADRVPSAPRPDRAPVDGARAADLICWFGIAASGLYALALIPIRPLLIGHHPVLLAMTCPE
ncbi:hypothetical protein [Actinoallomurus bryophytorum]|uniref:hypothetical protein n=1 Tax=Actinoallomurus bryophytorum TaxID=1490222 RepID=UPI00114F60A8|nr:hypothetical protein [Actinoallomurus bryophytorum]